MKAAALVADLIFASRITGAGRPVTIARTPGELEGADLVLVDLEAPGAIEAINRCRDADPRPRIVAFGPHVRAELMASARAAGADEVMARSAFVKRLEALLAE